MEIDRDIADAFYDTNMSLPHTIDEFEDAHESAHESAHAHAHAHGHVPPATSSYGKNGSPYLVELGRGSTENLMDEISRTVDIDHTILSSSTHNTQHVTHNAYNTQHNTQHNQPASDLSSSSSSSRSGSRGSDQTTATSNATPAVARVFRSLTVTVDSGSDLHLTQFRHTDQIQHKTTTTNNTSNMSMNNNNNNKLHEEPLSPLSATSSTGRLHSVMKRVSLVSRTLKWLHRKSISKDIKVATARFYFVEGLAGRNPELSSTNQAAAIHSHMWFHDLRFLANLFILLMMLIPFFERPAWCFTSDCGDPSIILNSELPVLSIYTSLSLDAVCLAWFVLYDLILRHKAYGKPRSISAYIRILLVVAAWVDTIIAFIFPSQYRMMPYLRPILFVILREATLNRVILVAKSIFQIIDIMFLIACLIITFGWIAMLLFYNTKAGHENFNSFYTTYVNLFVLMTNSNFPDVMFEAYKEHRAYCIFFVVFLVFGLYLFLNLLLATFYARSKQQLKFEFEESARQRKEALEKAFALLDVNNESEISSAVMKSFLSRLDIVDKEYVLSKVDEDGNGTVDFQEFLAFSQIVSLNKHKTKPRTESRLRAMVKDKIWFHKLDRMVRTTYFEVVSDLIILGNLTTMTFQTWDLMSNQFGDSLIAEKFEIGFTLIYFLEVIAKILVLDVHLYFKQASNIMDFVIAWLSLAALIGMAVTDHNDKQVAILFMLRVPRILRLLTGQARFEHVIRTLGRLTPVSTIVLPILTFVYYLYAAIGVAAFGGKLYHGSPGLSDTAYDHAQYHLNNFNDFGSALVTQFSLTVTTNWHVTMDACAAVTNPVAKMYFVSFFFLSFMVCVNMFVALVIEVFVESAEEGDRLKAQQKLLHRGSVLDRMFSDGLDEDLQKKLRRFDSDSILEDRTKHRQASNRNVTTVQRSPRTSHITPRNGAFGVEKEVRQS